MFCGKCGEKLQDGAKFCGKCGWKVEGVEPVAEQEVKAEEAAPAELFEEETAAAQEPAQAAGAKKENAPKERKKKNLVFLLIPLALLVLAGIVIGVVCFVNSLKRQEVDLTGMVTFEVEGYSGYGTATVVLKEEELEDKYEDLISDHTKLRWSKFVKEVDLLDYKVTELNGLSNGDKIVLTWEYDKDKAAEEYKVDILCESIEYTVTGLTEIKKVDPFEQFGLTFSGVSGTGFAEIDYDEFPAYLDYFSYDASQWTDLSNGDEVVLSFSDLNKDYVAETFGYTLYPMEKTYVVSGLTEYVSKDAQMTDAAVEPLMVAAEKLIYEYVNSYWVQEASVKGLECVGHFISLPEDKYDSTKNVIGLIYKIDANLYMEGRNLDVEHYFPVLFENVILSADGTFSFDEYEMSRTSDRFEKSFEPESPEDVNVPGGSWYFYGYETLDEVKNEYDSYSISWTSMETESFVEKNYTASVYASLQKEQDAWAEKVKNADASVLIGDAIDAYLETTTGWAETASVNGVDCAELVLYAGNIVSDYVPRNYLDVVLKVDAYVEHAEEYGEFPYYYVVRYQNVSVGTDGKLTADLTTREAVNGSFTMMLGEEEIRDWWFSPALNVWEYDGYQTLEEVVTPEAELRKNRIFYRAEVVPYSAEEGTDLTAWGNADDTAVVEAAEAVFLETMMLWPESATLNSVECVDTYVISCGIPTKAKQYAVLLKINAEVAFADRSEALDYYYMVRFDNAQVADNGVVTADTSGSWVLRNLFTKMLGDEEVPGPEGEPALNVWTFDGFVEASEAEATILAMRDGHINYVGEKVPEPVVEEPAEVPETEGDGAAEDAEAVTPDAEGDAPAEDVVTEE